MRLSISTTQAYRRTIFRRIPLRRFGVNITFLLPALLIFTAFVIYPFLTSFYYSLTTWDGLDPALQFVGLANFQTLLRDSTILNDLKNTLIFAAGMMIVQNTISLVLAILLDGMLRRFAFLRVLFLIPTMLSSLAIGYAWDYIYSPIFGAINVFLRHIGLSSWAQDWLGNPRLALSSIIVTSVWQWVGFSLIIFLAGLQTIPLELYEAATIDGAKSWQRFRHIIFPLIAPSFTINVVLTLIGSMKIFDLIFVMTAGGPGGTTESLVLRVYKEAFTLNHFGYATAIGIVTSLIILAISAGSLLALRKREVEY
jgi:ABC-type sugar transport system permease subunit